MAQVPDQAERDALRAWLDHHDGLITTAAAHALGFGKRRLDGMVDRGELVRQRRALYRARGARWDLRSELRGALMQAGTDARLMLVSGLHWAQLLQYAAPLPQVGVPGEGRTRQRTGYRLYETRYAEPAPLDYGGLPCAAPIDALLHFAGHVRDHGARRALRRALREAVRRDHTLVAALGRAVDADPGIPGHAVLRESLATLDGALVVNSDLEEDFIEFCRIWGLPPFRSNYVVNGFERDVVWLLERLIVELDTRAYHHQVDALVRDRRRRRSAVVDGWRHVELTGYDLKETPEQVARDLSQLLGLVGWRPPARAAERWAVVIASARGSWLAP